MIIVKNLPYPDFNYIKNNLTKEAQQFIIDRPNECALCYLQYKKGSRLYVTKDVVKELNNVDIKNIDFSEIKFPSDSVEVFFENSELPTVLIGKRVECFNILSEEMRNVFRITCRIVNKSTGKEIQPLDKDDGISFLFGHLFEDHVVTYFTIPNEDINSWLLKNTELPHLDSKVPERPHDAENVALGKKLLILCCKVFLYISIPEYKAIPITDKGLQRHGKAGVKNRPNRPLSKVIYVPSIINVNKEKNHAESSGITIKPHMRRGHFMMLRNERYKERGKLIFRRPSMIHGGSLQDKLYVARKID